MAEWQIIESDDFPEAVDEKPIPVRNRFRQRRGLFFGGVVIFFIAIGVFFLYQQRANGRIALRNDLTTYIFEEEGRRHLGKLESLSYAQQASQEWQRIYFGTFEPDQFSLPPANINIIAFDFDGECATVTVDLVNTMQVRTYCLDEQGWYRAPVPVEAWGQNQEIIELANGVKIHFFSPDQPFAETLASDLPPVFETLARHSLWPGEESRFDNVTRLEIKIVPQDLHAPLIVADEEKIILNSPLLTPFQTDTGLSGQTAVRLALGEALIRRTMPAHSEINSFLPGSSRFMTANQTVLAMHLFLAPEAQSTLAGHWRARLGRDWTSPFFLSGPDQQQSAYDPQAKLTARIASHYIYSLKGAEPIFTILQQLPVTYSWDRLFQAVLNRATFEVERSVEAYTRTGDAGLISANTPLDDRRMLTGLTFTATLLYLDEANETATRAYIEGPDLQERLWVELPGELFPTTRGGLPLDLRCAGVRPGLTITGQWLELYHRVQATNVTVQRFRPLGLEPAPADATAYLLVGLRHDPQVLAALTQAGTLQTLIPLSPTLEVFPLPQAPEEKPHFLFRASLSGCDRSWFVHYRPTQPDTEQWLGPPDLTQWVWRADKGDLVFFNDRTETSSYDIYQANDMLQPKFIRRSTLSQKILGWNIKNERLVSHVTQPEGYYLGLLDMVSGNISRHPYYLPLQARTLSPDGEWLAYLASSLNTSMPPNRIELLNLTDGTPRGLMVTQVREAFLPPVWSLDLVQPKIAVLAGPVAVEEGAWPVPTRLLVASVDQSRAVHIVAEAESGEQFISPVICMDGTVLYIVQANNRYQIRRQSPGQQPQLLGTFNQPLHPLAC